jgi:hypothetical protein
MSRGPQVLDMEYREPDRLEHGPGGPIFSSFQRLHFVIPHNLALVSLHSDDFRNFELFWAIC